MEGIAETNNQNQDEALPGPAREVVTDVPQPDTQTGPADQKTFGADERTPKDMPADTTAQLVPEEKTQAESSVVAPQTVVDEKTPQAATDEKKAQPESSSQAQQKKSIIMCKPCNRKLNNRTTTTIT
ncbi:hypothetical protein PSTT_01991 [Puccinia striiformis]|uniref:Uncharacterized protein n=1 Tax=Puccinia striiformis TaxID=27350 RepID=A0A2S4W1H4_9BASI|nr:hypothetical protein PSTT_01991 [Puccinia striiformis]